MPHVHFNRQRHTRTALVIARIGRQVPVQPQVAELFADPPQVPASDYLLTSHSQLAAVGIENRSPDYWGCVQRLIRAYLPSASRKLVTIMTSSFLPCPSSRHCSSFPATRTVLS